jgi:hypothetical protein
VKFRLPPKPSPIQDRSLDGYAKAATANAGKLTDPIARWSGQSLPAARTKALVADSIPDAAIPPDVMAYPWAAVACRYRSRDPQGTLKVVSTLYPWLDASSPDGILEALLTSPLREAASWRLAAELVRRYPQKLFILHAFPISGVEYDCLRISRIDGKGWMELNRAGTGSARRIHVDRGEDVRSALLMHWLSADDRRGLIRDLSSWLAMSSISNVPPSTDRVIAYRVIARFLTARCLDREAWSCRGALWLDDMGTAWFREDDMSVFGLNLVPKNLEVTIKAAEDPAANCWFLCRDGRPVIAVRTDGRVQNTQGRRLNVVRRYRTSRNLDVCVAALSRLLH